MDHAPLILQNIARIKYSDIFEYIDLYYTTLSCISDYLIISNQINLGISFLLKCLRVGSNGNDSILNPAYTQLLRLCIHGKQFSIAKPLIEKEYGFDINLTGIEAKDILLFYYYSGYIALIFHNYRLAYSSFRSALSIPTDAPHLCQYSAAKKYLLVNCILDEVSSIGFRISK